MSNNKANSRPGLVIPRDSLSRPKRSQVTIFIIIGILIVSAVLVFYLWIQPKYLPTQTGKLGFEGCVADAVEKEIENLGKQSGFIEPEFYYLYQNDKIGYLCYTNLYYKACSVQKPFLKQHFEEQLERKVREEVYSCYENSINELKGKGYDVVSGNVDFEILLEPKQVVVKIDAPTSVSRQATQKFTTFTQKINSPIYDILMIATSILQFETKYGDSDVTTLMMFYPELIIDKIKRGDGTTVYIIEDKPSKTKFQFAVRSFAWPAGYGADTGLVMGE